MDHGHGDDCDFVGKITCQIQDDENEPIMSCDPDDHNGECPNIEVSLMCSCNGRTTPPTTSMYLYKLFTAVPQPVNHDMIYKAVMP